MNSVTEPAIQQTRQSGHVPTAKDWLDALATGACDLETFLRGIAVILQRTPEAGWDLFALVDQYYRRGKISTFTFGTLKAHLQSLLVGGEQGIDLSGPLGSTSQPAMRAATPARAASHRDPASAVSGPAASKAPLAAQDIARTPGTPGPAISARPGAARAPATSTTPDAAQAFDPARTPNSARIPNAARAPDFAHAPDASGAPDAAREANPTHSPDLHTAASARPPGVAGGLDATRAPSAPDAAREPDHALIPDAAHAAESARAPSALGLDSARTPDGARIPDPAHAPYTAHAAHPARGPDAGRTADAARAGDDAARQRPQRALASGDLLRGRYLVKELIGQGGMGTVFAATDQYRLDRSHGEQRVAIKVLHTEVIKRPRLFAELRREFQHLQALSHPNIVRVHEFDRDGDLAFFTMEYLSGAMLSRVLAAQESGGLQRPYALAIIRDVGAAIAHAHARSVVHGDLNPGNIFINDDGEVRVLDFGASHQLHRGPWISEFDNQRNVAVATPLYASCQLLEGEAADARDDVYALACIAYVLFTGTHPFLDNNALKARTARMTPARPPGLNRRQWNALLTGLQFERDRRPIDIQAWLAELDLDAAAPKLPALTSLTTAPRSHVVKGNRWPVYALLVVLLVLAGWWVTEHDDTLAATGTGAAARVESFWTDSVMSLWRDKSGVFDRKAEPVIAGPPDSDVLQGSPNGVPVPMRPSRDITNEIAAMQTPTPHVAPPPVTSRTADATAAAPAATPFFAAGASNPTPAAASTSRTGLVKSGAPAPIDGPPPSNTLPSAVGPAPSAILNKSSPAAAMVASNKDAPPGAASSSPAPYTVPASARPGTSNEDSPAAGVASSPPPSTVAASATTSNKSSLSAAVASTSPPSADETPQAAPTKSGLLAAASSTPPSVASTGAGPSAAVLPASPPTAARTVASASAAAAADAAGASQNFTGPRARIELAADSIDVPATDTVAHVLVKRSRVTRGDVSFTWWTESGTAKPGKDFTPVEPHVVQIDSGKMVGELVVPVVSDPARKGAKSFYVVIDQPSNNAALGPRTLTMITLPEGE